MTLQEKYEKLQKTGYDIRFYINEGDSRTLRFTCTYLDKIIYDVENDYSDVNMFSIMFEHVVNFAWNHSTERGETKISYNFDATMTIWKD